MTLDQRAARASEGLRRAVAESELRTMRSGHPRRAAAVFAFASAFAGVLLVIGALTVQSRWFAGESGTTLPDVTVTQPAPTTEVTAPATSTTSTPATSTTSTTGDLAPAAVAPAVDTTPPEIQIDYPEPEARFSDKTVRFEGTVEPGARVTVGRYEADVAGDRWSIVLVLTPGGNLARVTATDEAGNTSEATVRVFYDPPEEKLSVEFTAFAKWGSCSEDPPYDEYYGTAKPGSTVEVFSEFGGGSTVADADGNWYVKVYFETAPYDEPFLVKAKDVFGQKTYFEFVRQSA